MLAVVCEWEGDLSVGPSGDIGVAVVQVEVQRRLIRRLLTNSGEYIWHIGYGAGLGSYVGETYSSALIEGTILSQLQYEALVVTHPLPTVTVGQSVAGSFPIVAVTVRYQVAGTFNENSVVLELGT
jgi:hypothetical protein